MTVIRHNEITVALPAGWQDGTQVVAVSPAQAEFRPNLVITSEPVEPDQEMGDYATKQLARLREALEEFVLLVEGEANYGVAHGYIVEYELTASNMRLKQAQFYLTANAMVYTYTYTNLAGSFD